MQELANDAEEVQNASNFSGVIHSLYNDVIPSLRALGINSSDEIATHPVVKAFIFKAYDLSFRSYDIVTESLDLFSKQLPALSQ
jgi:hypothetical protein